MLIYLLSVTLNFLFGPSQPPNFYQSFTSAKEASKSSQKEMVVFFTSKTCGNCEAAWSAFAKDVKGAQQYISTRMDMEDFDGSVCYNFYELNQVPSWVILSPASEVKEKWSGGWKDAAGNPTSFDQSVPQSIVKEEKKVNAPSQNSSFTTSNKSTPPPAPKENTSTSKEISKPVSVSSTNTSSTEGFVLQAGYFGSETNAQKLVSDLKAKGFAGFKIEYVPKDGTNFYRVISKKYTLESDVNTDQQRMTNAGFKTSVKKI